MIAGDVYTQPPYVGRGGWSWYTGSAAWLHRAAIQSICGLNVRGASVCIRPQLPSHWQTINVTLRRKGRTHEFIICSPTAEAQIALALARGAVRLPAGEWLSLAGSADASRHVVVAARADAPAEHIAPANVAQ